MVDYTYLTGVFKVGDRLGAGEYYLAAHLNDDRDDLYSDMFTLG